jgi:hypothetical protein
MRERFAAGEFERGAVEGIDAVNELLRRHLPAPGPRPEGLPDRPAVL